MRARAGNFDADELAWAVDLAHRARTRVYLALNTLVYDDESGIVAGGVGGRYLFRPQDSLWIGVDVAKGPEDTYAYIQVGHAW